MPQLLRCNRALQGCVGEMHCENADLHVRDLNRGTGTYLHKLVLKVPRIPLLDQTDHVAQSHKCVFVKQWLQTEQLTPVRVKTKRSTSKVGSINKSTFLELLMSGIIILKPWDLQSKVMSYSKRRINGVARFYLCPEYGEWEKASLCPYEINNMLTKDSGPDWFLLEPPAQGSQLAASLRSFQET